MAAARPEPAELGLAQAAPAWRLRREQFPSKVGGRPAWLGAAGLPGPAALSCAQCGRPLAFLLQLYAPLPGRADAFHRGLFLFCCRAPPCCAGLRVFRNQLPRKNDFFSYEPPSEDPPPETGDSPCLQLQSGPHLCRVCGCLGPKTCSRCHKAHYCSKEHQTLDWRLGHKQACAESENLGGTVPDHNFLFPEYEIVIETEDEVVSEVENEDEAEVAGNMDETPEEELDSLAKHESKEDKIFQKFKTKIDLVPEQIEGNINTWEIFLVGQGLPSTTFLLYPQVRQRDCPHLDFWREYPSRKGHPDCPCGAKRIFEFQVMPQLLYYLKADRLGRSVDWGVLAIFTCAESCRLVLAMRRSLCGSKM